jgi:N-hydroxyarylamine O-acetyltransferase
MRLPDYLARIRQPAPSARSAAELQRLHRAHRETFLFENLAIQTGGGIALAICDLERKFLDEGRGGYCFEHNSLFAAALRELGVDSAALLGRVRRGPPHRWCRTHMVLRVPIDGEVWLADVGFGAMGLLDPIPLGDGVTSLQGGFTYHLRRERELWVLSARDAAVEMDLYEFTEDPQTQWDIEVANHFTSTHPESIFRKSLTVQQTRGSARTILRSETLTRYRDGVMTEEPVARERLSEVARAAFGVELPRGPFVFESEQEREPFPPPLAEGDGRATVDAPKRESAKAGRRAAPSP